MSMRSDLKTTQYATVPASAADDSSSASRSLSASSVAAGACGIATHTHFYLELGVSYSGESDVSESENTLMASCSPAVPLSSRDLPKQRTCDIRHSMFGIDYKYGDECYYSSQNSTRAPSNKRVDYGEPLSYRNACYRQRYYVKA